MSVSEDQVLGESDGEETITDDLPESDADTYLLFTKPMFEDKANIGNIL